MKKYYECMEIELILIREDFVRTSPEGGPGELPGIGEGDLWD